MQLTCAVFGAKKNRKSGREKKEKESIGKNDDAEKYTYRNGRAGITI